MGLSHFTLRFKRTLNQTGRALGPSSSGFKYHVTHRYDCGFNWLLLKIHLVYVVLDDSDYFFLLIIICSLNVGFMPLKDYAFVDMILFISKTFLYRIIYFYFLVLIPLNYIFFIYFVPDR